MNDTSVRELFEEMLADEPASATPVHEDLARGRAVRVRRRRRRLAGASAAVAVTAAASLAVPVLPHSLIDGGGAMVAPAPDGPTDVPTEIADDPVRLDLWHAVADALPADVDIQMDGAALAIAGGLYVPLVRDGYSFGLHVWLQEARPDLDEFRPCSEPVPRDFYVQPGGCEEGHDEAGRWRVLARAQEARIGVAVLEDDSTSVTLRWDRTGYPSPRCAGDVCEAISEADVQLVGNLSPAEADAIAAAVWAAGSRYSPASLSDEIDLQATFDRWPDLVAALESTLGAGEFGPARPPGVAADIDGPAGSIAASYPTADGVTVEVLVWQKERIYDPFCIEDWCNFLPDVYQYAGSSSGMAKQASLGSIIGLGTRAGVEIWVDSTDPDVNQGLADVTSQLEQLVPMLGDQEQ